MLSYQHAYHVGNFADVQKHVLLCHILQSYSTSPKRITYIDTHSGRGLYDLKSVETEKTLEWKDGIQRLRNAPSVQSSLIQQYLTAVTPYLETERYPGSPQLISDAMASNHHGLFFEYHPTEVEHLKSALSEDRRVRIHHADAQQDVLSHLPNRTSDGLILIDPSYEIKTDYEQTARFASNLHKRWPAATILIWYPILPENRHETLKTKLPAQAESFELIGPQKERGMYGTGMAVLSKNPAALDLPAFKTAQDELHAILFVQAG